MESLKKSLIHSFCALPLIDGLSNTKIVFITHTGIIIGSPVQKNDPDKAINNLATVSMKCVDDYRQEHSLDTTQPLDGNDGFIILKDVELKSNNTTYRFNYMNIFYDQIVGITLADGI